MQCVADDAVEFHQGQADGVGAMWCARAEETHGFAAQTRGAYMSTVLQFYIEGRWGRTLERTALVWSLVRRAVFVLAWKRYISHTWLYSCRPSRLSLG